MFRLALLFNTINPTSTSLCYKNRFSFLLVENLRHRFQRKSCWHESEKVPLGSAEPTLGFLLDVLKEPRLCLLSVVPEQLKLNINELPITWITMINCGVYITFLHCHTFTHLPTSITITYLPSIMAMWPVWPKVNSSAGWLMLANVESP